jgi:Cytidylyltransferase-like
MNYLVIYPGRFHPFHLGHKASYDYLLNKYGPESVYIVTSDKQAPVSSPFSYSDKVEMMTKLGVPASHVVKVRNPYQATEITDNLTPEQRADTALIFAVSAKDAERFDFKPKRDGSASYMQPLPEYPGQGRSQKRLKPMTKAAYVDITPTVNFKVRGQDANSASAIRQMFIDGNDADRDQIITDLYGAPDSSLRDMFKKKLGITDHVVKMMQECRRLATARSLALMERVMRAERAVLQEFSPSKPWDNNDNVPDLYESIDYLEENRGRKK